MSEEDNDKSNATESPNFATDPSRRRFLQVSAAIAGSTLLSSCSSDNGSLALTLPGDSDDNFSNIKHLVVVMFENRSFDHLLGYLYSDCAIPQGHWPSGTPVPPVVPTLNGNAQSFNGLWQFPLTAPAACEGGSHGCNEHDGKVVPAFPNPAGNWDLPAPDPYEPWEHVRMQAFDIDRSLKKGDKPNMSGFLRNYADRIASDEKEKDPLKDPPDPMVIMGAYTPDQLPVLSTLAQNFAVFDNWYCAVPSQTYCNRAFLHASTSHGFVKNDPWEKWQGVDTGNGTIFDQLEDLWENTTPQPATAPWAVYFSGGIDPEVYTPILTDKNPATVTDFVGLTGLIHYEVGTRHGPENYPNRVGSRPQRFFGFEQFFSDVKAGTLPQYTFIEPLGGDLPFSLPVQGVGGHDFHPPQPHKTTDLRNGEEVIRQIYDAIRTSGTNGHHDYTQDTMLLILFDEHGGTYDHAKLKEGIPPDKSKLEAEDCDFSWLGVRVPAIAISSYTQAGTICNDEMHHAAVIKTLFKMNPGTALSHLTERDKPATVNDLSVACNSVGPAPRPWPELVSPLPPSDCPIVGE